MKPVFPGIPTGFSGVPLELMFELPLHSGIISLSPRWQLGCRQRGRHRSPRAHLWRRPL